MKKIISKAWNALGTTGKVFLALFLFYFISKSFKP